MEIRGSCSMNRGEPRSQTPESWLLPNPGGGTTKGVDGMDLNTGQFVFGSEMDPYLDLDPYVDTKVEAFRIPKSIITPL